MTLLEALILGFVQGLTEFLPISSSGHLELFQRWFEITESTLTFDVFLHAASLVAIVWFFRAEILKLTVREYWLLAVGTLPAIAFGLLFKDAIETVLAAPLLLGIQFLVNGGINAVIHFRLERKTGDAEIEEKPNNAVQLAGLNEKKAFGIGIFQAIAMIPAISRSGSTLLGSLLLGLDKKKAFTFTFLLAIPAILGANVFEVIGLITGSQTMRFSLPVFAMGFVGSLAASLWSLTLLRQFVAQSRFLLFSAYCTILGLGIIAAQFIR